jgi:hypothetical protein
MHALGTSSGWQMFCSCRSFLYTMNHEEEEKVTEEEMVTEEENGQ